MASIKWEVVVFIHISCKRTVRQTVTQFATEGLEGCEAIEQSSPYTR